MSKKSEFIDYVKALISAQEGDPIEPSEDAAAYWEALCGGNTEDKPTFTDNGKLIMKYLQELPADAPMMKAKEIAEGMFVSSRAVSAVCVIRSNFCSVSASIPAKSSRTVFSPLLSLNSSLMPLIKGLTTVRSTLPRFVFSVVRLVSNCRNPFAYPSEVLAKSPCASAVACIRY